MYHFLFFMSIPIYRWYAVEFFRMANSVFTILKIITTYVVFLIAKLVAKYSKFLFFAKFH